VRVHSHAEVTGTVLMHGVDVGRGAIVKNAIVDKNVRIEPGRRSVSTPKPTGGASWSPTAAWWSSAREHGRSVMTRVRS